MSASHVRALQLFGPSPVARRIGPYYAERVLSRGPFGVILKASQLETAEPVVLKLLPPYLRDDPASVLRLAREAHVLVHIAGPHVVRLLDSGWTEATGPYLVLEYLVGQDLGRRLTAAGPLPWPLAASYILQACDGLAAAHRAGILHCDLKPDNLFAVETAAQPLLKVIDFGVCRCGPDSFPLRDIGAFDEDQQELLGTPPYLSPERVRACKSVDQRSDIWSLGVILHELVTGYPLFSGATSMETCTLIVDHRFRLESDTTLLPRPLRTIVARCLARRPAQRYPDVAELAAALRGVLALPASLRGRVTGTFRRGASDACD